MSFGSLSLGRLSLGYARGAGGGVPPASFTMSQLAADWRIYQRSTSTGGGQGKGTGTIPVSADVSTAGQVWARCRDAADGTTIVQAAWKAAEAVSTGVQTLQIAGVDAREGWFYLDLSGDGATWQNGTIKIGMGRVVAVAGQSLAVRMFAIVTDTATMASLGVTIDDNCSVYATYSDSGRPGEGGTAAWTKPADATSYDSAYLGEFLRREIDVYGVNCALIGHSVGATAISVWVPGGGQNSTLRARLDEVGGFESFIWFQGHSDSAAGTTKAAYKSALDDLFADVTAHNGVKGGSYSKLLCAIPNLTGGWGTPAQRDTIRQAHLEWANENSGVYSIPMDITLIDGVHQSQAGNVRLGERFSAALNNQPVNAPSLNMVSATYATGETGFGSEITGGYGNVARSYLEAIMGTEWTMEARFSISSAPASTKVMMGYPAKGWLGIGTDGRLVCNLKLSGGSEIYLGGGGAGGGSTNPVISDGLRHHVRYSVTATGAYLFLDGVLVASTASAPWGSAGDAAGIGVHTFGTSSGYAWPGTVDEATIWATCKSTSGFTPPTAPYTGTENGLVGVYHLDGDGTGKMAA